MERHDIISWIGNGGSAGVIITTLIGWTPSIAAIVAMIWYLIQISESPTVRNWIARRRQARLAKLRAAVLLLETKIQPETPED